MKRDGLLKLATALFLCLAPAVASADILFSGSWSPGAETGPIAPAPLTFTANASGTDSWGVPGVGLGTRPWPDGNGFQDFHISFTLPAGVDIDTAFGTNCVGGAGGGTVFCAQATAGGAFINWLPVSTGPDSIDFFAPAGVTLDAGESLFVNIFFTGDAPSGSFVGSWSSVPEPGTLALLGMMLAGLGFGHARRRAGPLRAA